jgi:hypothetical protein
MASPIRNPKNPESTLFGALTRLFSGPLADYRRQTYQQLKRRQLDKYKFTSASGKAFKRSDYSPLEHLQSHYLANQNRAQRYVDFEQMEYEVYLSAALDLVADEVTTCNSLQPLLNIKCVNEEIKTVLRTLFYDLLNIEANLFGWTRNLLKFGDMFLYLDVDEKRGIQSVIGLPSQEVERLEGEDRTNPNYVQFQWNTGGITFENWQIAHFRLLGQDRYAPYGQSFLDPARRIWRQLSLMEDAMIAYRLVRAPERRVFYIDVGGINPNDVEEYMQRVMTTMKRTSIVDPDTGRIDLRYSPHSIEEDYFLPVRGGASASKIDTLSGGKYVEATEDVKYLRDKMVTAIKIPPAYLVRSEGGGEEDKTTLAQKDIFHARTVQRIQRAVVAELTKIAIVHLYTLGFKKTDLLSFELLLNNPSKLAELQELEYWRTKFSVATSIPEGMFSKRWLAVNLFGMSEEDFQRNQREIFVDKKLEAEWEVIAGTAEARAEAMVTAAGRGGITDEMSGLAGETEEEAAPEAGESASEPEEGESALLAAPAKRKDGYVTPGAKGKVYVPVSSDRRPMGARLRHYKGQWASEVGSSTARNVVKGREELSTLARGIAEEEEKILNVSRETSRLLESLDRGLREEIPTVPPENQQEESKKDEN